MEDAVLYVREVGKRRDKKKKKSTFPTIQRIDVMKYILSDVATKSERAKLSSMYSEIIRMEMKKMEYITEIAISSQNDADIYDLINKLKGEEKKKQKHLKQQNVKVNQC